MLLWLFFLLRQFLILFFFFFFLTDILSVTWPYFCSGGLHLDIAECLGSSVLRFESYFANLVNASCLIEPLPLSFQRGSDELFSSCISNGPYIMSSGAGMHLWLFLSKDQIDFKQMLFFWICSSENPEKKKIEFTQILGSTTVNINIIVITRNVFLSSESAY